MNVVFGYEIIVFHGDVVVVVAVILVTVRSSQFEMIAVAVVQRTVQLVYVTAGVSSWMYALRFLGYRSDSLAPMTMSLE